MANSNAADSDNSLMVLSVLSVTFPLHVEVKNAKDVMSFEVDQNYTVIDLDKETLPKVTQNFIVKK